jgi:tetratricopeptide (TPR) repeat protein
MLRARELRDAGDLRACRTELEAALRQTSPASHDAAVTQNELGLVHHYLREYSEAEKHFWRAIDLIDLRRTIAPLNNLVTMYLELGAHRKVEDLRLEEKLKQGNLSDLETARLAENIAGLYFVKGKRQQAERYYRQALEIWEQLGGVESKETAAVLNNLAVIAWRNKRFTEAEAHLNRACAILRKPGVDPARVPIALANLGSLYATTGKHSQAEDNFRESFAEARRIFGEESVEMAEALMLYSQALEKMKRKSEAKEYAARAKDLIRRLPAQRPGLSVDITAFRAAERLRFK